MLITTQIQIHIRFLDFQNWPHSLWTLTSKYNPDGYIAKCEQFLLSSRDMFDAGYTQLLFDVAWQAGDLLAALEFLFAKETQNELCTIMERSEASSLDAERKNQQDKRGEKKDKVTSLHRASAHSILQSYSVWRHRRMQAYETEKKMISKYAKIPARALAIMRNPELFGRARGQLHWQDPVGKAERKKIIHHGDEAKLKQYMEDNKESLRQEAGKLRAEAKLRREELEHFDVPITNLQWMKYLEKNDTFLRSLLTNSTETRKKYSTRLDALDGLRPCVGQLSGKSDTSPDWLRKLLPKVDGPFYLLKWPTGGRVALLCSRVGAVVLGYKLRLYRASGQHMCALDLVGLEQHCVNALHLCTSLRHVAELSSFHNPKTVSNGGQLN